MAFPVSVFHIKLFRIIYSQNLIFKDPISIPQDFVILFQSCKGGQSGPIQIVSERGYQ